MKIFSFFISISVASITLGFISQAYSKVSLEQSCSAIDLREELGPPRDQGSTGTCYANTTADLVTQALEEKISAVGIVKSFLFLDEKALVKSSNAEVRAFVNENPDLILRVREDKNLEPDHMLPKNLFAYSEATDDDGDIDVEYKGIFDIGGSEDAALLMAGEEGFCKNQKLGGEGDVAYEDHLKKINAYFEKRLSKSNGKRSGITSDELARSMMQAFSSWVNQMCGERIIPAKPLIPKILFLAKNLKSYKNKIRLRKLKLADVRKKIFSEIDKNLERHRVSAVGYEFNDHTGERKSDDHSAIIAARKVVNGQCHYFLRSSFGKDCSFYAEKYHKATLCEEEYGGIWVTPAELKSAYSVISIK